MSNVTSDIESMISDLEHEIETYTQLLSKYGRGRWYWKYRRELDNKHERLELLKHKHNNMPE